MAKIVKNAYLAIDTQSAQGTVNATVAALSGAVTESDGAVLGVRGSGIADSGIEFAAAATISEKADASGSFTKQAASFLGEEITWSIQIELKGNGATASTPPIDGDMVLDNGINALWAACGFAEAAWATGVGSELKPSTLTHSTAKVWVNGLAWVVMDVVGSPTIEFTPSEVATVTFNMQGIVSSFAEATASLTYGNQASLSAPVVKGVANSWGQTRGFNELSLSVDNSIEQIGDSNETTVGYVLEQGDRTITLDCIHFQDDGDLDFERANMVNTSAPTDDLSFTIGTVATDGSTIDAVTIQANNAQVRSVTLVDLGAKAGIQSSSVLTGTTANSEISIIFV